MASSRLQTCPTKVRSWSQRLGVRSQSSIPRSSRLPLCPHRTPTPDSGCYFKAPELFSSTAFSAMSLRSSLIFPLRSFSIMELMRPHPGLYAPRWRRFPAPSYGRAAERFSTTWGPRTKPFVPDRRCVRPGRRFGSASCRTSPRPPSHHRRLAGPSSIRSALAVFQPREWRPHALPKQPYCVSRRPPRLFSVVLNPRLSAN